MGLSPRVRGNPNTKYPQSSRIRSIPARTGEPTAERNERSPLPSLHVGETFRRGKARIYPRAYGGTAQLTGVARTERKVYPRAYGGTADAVKEVPIRAELRRSIPARTGEPVAIRAYGGTARLSTVYPRAYGGTADAVVVYPGYCRAPVYPRAYGGTGSNSSVRTTVYGLSPRVRGNQHPLGIGAEMIGSIPARTGEPLAARPLAKPNSSRVTPLVVLYQVHSVGIDYGLWRRAQRPDALLPGMVCSPKAGPAVMPG